MSGASDVDAPPRSSLTGIGLVGTDLLVIDFGRGRDALSALHGDRLASGNAEFVSPVPCPGVVGRVLTGCTLPTEARDLDALAVDVPLRRR